MIKKTSKNLLTISIFVIFNFMTNLSHLSSLKSFLTQLSILNNESDEKISTSLKTKCLIFYVILTIFLFPSKFLG